MPRVLEKVERRLGERLFIKGERCLTPKCAEVRKPYPPGVHGKKRYRGGSEFGELLKEKQKIRFTYGLDNNALKTYSLKAKGSRGSFEQNLLKLLERRLDNVVYRLGFAVSRSIARQLVSHGHFFVNGRVVNIPSYQVRVGDRIEINPSSSSLNIFADLPQKFKKYNPPQWLLLDKEKTTGSVLRDVSKEDLGGTTINLSLITEFYSR